MIKITIIMILMIMIIFFPFLNALNIIVSIHGNCDDCFQVILNHLESSR